MFKKKKDALNQFFEEMSARLHEELDYTLEADNVRLMRDFHTRFDWATVPDVGGRAQRPEGADPDLRARGSHRGVVRGYSPTVRDLLGRRNDGARHVPDLLAARPALGSEPGPTSLSQRRGG